MSPALGDRNFFGEVTRAGFHQRALRMVADGEVDASAIDCQVLAVELGNDPSLRERIRVLAVLGPAPSQPVVLRSSLPGEVKAGLQKRLLALGGPVLEKHHVKGFADLNHSAEVR